MVAEKHSYGYFGERQEIAQAVNEKSLVVLVEFCRVIDKEHQGGRLRGNLGGVVNSGHAHFVADRGGALVGDAGDGFV